MARGSKKAGLGKALKTAAVLFAGVMGFKERPSFTAEEGASAAPKVTF